MAAGVSAGGPGALGGMGSGSGVDSAWAQLHVCVLPLFNGERLLMPMYVPLLKTYISVY